MFGLDSCTKLLPILGKLPFLCMFLSFFFDFPGLMISMSTLSFLALLFFFDFIAFSSINSSITILSDFSIIESEALWFAFDIGSLNSFYNSFWFINCLNLFFSTFLLTFSITILVSWIFTDCFKGRRMSCLLLLFSILGFSFKAKFTYEGL